MCLKKELSLNDHELTKMALFCPSKIGFDARNQDGLQKCLEPLISKLSNEVFGATFEAIVKEINEAFEKETFDVETLEKLQGWESQKEWRQW